MGVRLYFLSLSLTFCHFFHYKLNSLLPRQNNLDIIRFFFSGPHAYKLREEDPNDPCKHVPLPSLHSEEMSGSSPHWLPSLSRGRTIRSARRSRWKYILFAMIRKHTLNLPLAVWTGEPPDGGRPPRIIMTRTPWGFRGATWGGDADICQSSDKENTKNIYCLGVIKLFKQSTAFCVMFSTWMYHYLTCTPKLGWITVQTRSIIWI